MRDVEDVFANELIDDNFIAKENVVEKNDKNILEDNVENNVNDVSNNSQDKLDKFYTKENIAQSLLEQMISFIKNDLNNDKPIIFLEPSAGSGSFVKSQKDRFIAIDILPTNNQLGIIHGDFLSIKNNLLKEKQFNENFIYLSDLEKQVITRYCEILTDLNINVLFDSNEKINNQTYLISIGNPPFGKKSNLAIQFLNKCLEMTNLVGFIVPIQFKKWSVQKNIHKEAKLIKEIDLVENSFIKFDEKENQEKMKDFSIRCVFQIWSLNDFGLQDFRIKEKPKTNHVDFEMYQYNRTKEALKYFDYDWDFAVYRQGFLDYEKKFFKKEECNPKQQFMFIKAKNKQVLETLLSIDFTKLSLKNSNIPGFGKADLVEEYERILLEGK